MMADLGQDELAKIVTDELAIEHKKHSPLAAYRRDKDGSTDE